VFVALTVAAAVLAAMLILSASLKLRRREESIRVIHGVVGVPLGLFPLLAGLEVAGAAGAVVGLWLEPLGIAAALGVVVYFVIAVGAHLRVGDVKGVTNPLVPLVVGAVVLALRIATA
jgi:hypothetical protein